MNRKLFIVSMIIIGASFFAPLIFAQSADRDFSIDENGTITRYEGWDDNVVIPSTVRGITVTGIGDRAFESNELTGVTIPNTVTWIGAGAFRNNMLSSVTIPESVTFIGSEAFRNNRLASLAMRGSGINIGNGAFRDNRLAEIALPGNNIIIGENAFSNNQLAGVAVTGENSQIGPYAFSGNSLTSITLGRNLAFGENIIQISSGTSSLFYDYVCNNREAGTYTANRTRASQRRDGDYSFYETQYGAYITNYHGSGGNRLIIPSEIAGLPVRAISGLGNKNIGRVQIPNGVYYIAANAFAGNQITTVIIPDSVTYIGNEAFRYNLLTEIDMPSGLTYIGSYAFAGRHDWDYGNGNQFTSIVIPASVAYIGRGAFAYNPLTSITIGAGVTLEMPYRTEYWEEYPGSFNNGFDAAYYNSNLAAGTYTQFRFGDYNFWSAAGSDSIPAVNVELGRTYSAALQYGSRDWYRITITAGTLTVYTESSMDTYMELFDTNGSRISYDDDSGQGANARISRNMPAGTYYILVRGYSDSYSGPYTLHVTR